MKYKLIVCKRAVRGSNEQMLAAESGTEVNGCLGFLVAAQERWWASLKLYTPDVESAS